MQIPPPPISIWLSALALLVSICSFALAYRNTRRTNLLDTLARRTRLLLMIGEANTKLAAAKAELASHGASISSLKSLLTSKAQGAHEASVPGLQAGLKSLQELEVSHGNFQSSIASSEAEINKVWTTFEGRLTEKSDPMEIERLIPLVQQLLTGIDSVCTPISQHARNAEKRLEEIEDNERSFKQAMAAEQSKS